MDHGVKDCRKSHPYDRANILSMLTFFYTLRIFQKGYQKPFQEHDVFQVVTSCESKKLGDQLEHAFNIEKSKTTNVSIYKLLWICYGKQYLLIGCIQLFARSFIVILNPWAVGRLISYFNSNQTELSKNDAILYAVLVIALNVINLLYTHNYMLKITEFGIRIRTAFSSLIYRKALNLTSKSLSEISIGNILTLITKDVTAFEKMVLYGNDIWIGFAQAFIVSFLIYMKMGVAAFAGVGFLMLVLPIQIYIGKQASSFRLKNAKKTDERLQTTQETLMSIKTVKMFVWQEFFQQKINTYRRKEVKEIVKIFLSKSSNLLIGALTSKVAFYLLVMTYVWLGNTITAELIYFILLCFQRLRHSLSVLIPLGLTEAAELNASIQRINNLLSKSDEQFSNLSPESKQTKTYVKLIDANVELNTHQILTNVNLIFENGLSIVTGPVGSGKSALLKTILQDYQLLSGKLIVSGTISYAAQEPWIFPSTIKQNILYGLDYDSHRYQIVLEVCALKFDLALLQSGDRTMIGDRGLNLSRGQKARINLARAVYRDCDIYLFDDCLSYLDADVKEYIVQKCIKGFLSDKVCIVVTHCGNLLKAANSIVAMRNGRVEECVNGFESVLSPTLEEVEDQNENEGSQLLATDNIYKEKKASKEVKFSVYFNYVTFGGGFFVFGILLGLFGLTQFLRSYSDKTVSNWVNLEQNISDYELKNLTSTPEYRTLLTQHSDILKLFSTLTASIAISAVITFTLLFNFTRRASNNLHSEMLSSVIDATMNFFDTNLIGNILNRFSKDLASVDEQLPFILYEFIEIFMTLTGIIILISSVNLIFLIPSSLYFILLYIVRSWYLPTGRNLQRLDASTRAPIIGYVNASLEGLTTIRAFCKSKDLLVKEFDRHQDLYTSVNFTLKSCTRAFGFFLDLLCTVFIATVLARFLFFDYSDSLVGDVGLAISQVFMLTGLAQFGVRQWADLENNMTSVERVLEYIKIQKEDKYGARIGEVWPKFGSIHYRNVHFKYKNEMVLKDINFHIKPAEKIGIVGRTGAGKSSLISTLFRLYDLNEGEILIDNVDITSIELDYLRRSLTIIPQDAIIVRGTIRENFDPTGIHTDSEIWSAIETTNLTKLVSSLDSEISDSFSAGQTQLICLARAILSKHKIIILDEATANVDPEIDLVIQNVIKKVFKLSTVLIIAHKLELVLNCDRVMVMDNGSIVEFDKPEVLLQNKNGSFYRMAEASGFLDVIPPLT